MKPTDVLAWNPAICVRSEGHSDVYGLSPLPQWHRRSDVYIE